MTHYDELNQYSDTALKYFIDSEFPYNNDLLDYCSTGYIILSLRQNIDYSWNIIQIYIDHIEYLMGKYDEDED